MLFEYCHAGVRSRPQRLRCSKRVQQDIFHVVEGATISKRSTRQIKLRIDFDDFTRPVADFLPVLRGELYGPLRDLALFNQVTLDPEVHTLVWPNGRAARPPSKRSQLLGIL